MPPRMARKKARQLETFDGIQPRFLPQWSGQKRKNITTDDTASSTGSSTQRIEKRSRLFNTPVIFGFIFFFK
jgi:hypothetical protein